MKEPHRIRISRPSQIIAAELRSLILRGELDGDRRLPPEAELAAQLRVSRHHLREALRLLEQDGLVRIRRGHGGGISPSVPDSDVLARTFEGILARQGTLLSDVTVARLIIEPAGAQLAAQHATDQEIAALERLLAEQEAAQQYEPEINSEFHLALTAASHNQTLLLIMRALQPLIQNVDRHGSAADMLAGSVRAHRAILRTLKSRDAEGIGYLMRRHLLGYEEHLRAVGLNETCTVADTLCLPTEGKAANAIPKVM